ncbi:MAG: N-acetylmuramoyl-L-alanine amidase, partial [Candidatus Paceibacterota bacterium]
ESDATIQQRLNIPDRIVKATGRRKIVVIDAGHGGKDPGCSSRKGLKEKNINLAIARELAALFNEDGRFQVVMTRTTDCFIPLDMRSAAANRLNADIFISIHANANRRRGETGFEVYFMSENAKDPWAKEVAAFENSVRGLEDDSSVPPEGLLLHSLARNEYMNDSAILAGFITEHIAKRVPIKNRGVNQAPFYVLRGTYAPAVLIETGFMTNPKEAALLNKEAVRKKIAAGAYEGVLAYAKSKHWLKADE